MADDTKVPLAARLLASLAGIAWGAIAGAFLLIVIIIVTGFTFGLDTIWPGAVIGAAAGALFGFTRPKRTKPWASLSR